MSPTIENDLSSSLEELLEKAVPLGSSFYYSILGLNKDTRHNMSIVFALFKEWHKLSQNENEPQVAHTALSWWLEQITLLNALADSQQARHPLLQALSFLDNDKTVKSQLIEHMQTILVTFIQKPGRFQDSQSLSDFLLKTWGQFCTLSAIIINHKHQDDDSIQLAGKIGLAIGFHQIVKHLAKDLGQQRCSLPLDWLKESGCNPQSLSTSLQATGDTAIKNQLITKITKTLKDQQTNIKTLLKETETVARQAHLPSLIALNLESVRLQLTLKKDFKIIEYRLQLSPLRKLWISWRGKHHLRNGRFAKLLGLR